MGGIIQFIRDNILPLPCAHVADLALPHMFLQYVVIPDGITNAYLKEGNCKWVLNGTVLTEMCGQVATYVIETIAITRPWCEDVDIVTVVKMLKEVKTKKALKSVRATLLRERDVVAVVHLGDEKTEVRTPDVHIVLDTVVTPINIRLKRRILRGDVSVARQLIALLQ